MLSGVREGVKGCRISGSAQHRSAAQPDNTRPQA